MIKNTVTISGVQPMDSAIHINVSILSQTLLPSRLPHNIEQISMCYTVGLCCLPFFFLDRALVFVKAALIAHSGSGRSTGERIGYPLQYSWASLVAQLVKNPPAMWETWVRSLAWEDSLEKGKDIHSHILA